MNPSKAGASGVRPPRRTGPDIKAIPFNSSTDGVAVSLLSDAERHQLALIASIAHLKPASVLYEAGDPAEFLYIIIHGAVKTVRRLAGRKRAITAFLFPNDLVGLAAEGRYINTAVALAPLTVYRMPVAGLERVLLRNPELEYHFLCKVCHELREAQRHAISLGRKSAAERIAMLLHMLEHRQPPDMRDGEIALAMSRSDIADYAALSLESVSRTFRALQRGRIIAVRDKRHVRILDRARFEQLASTP